MNRGWEVSEEGKKKDEVLLGGSSPSQTYLSLMMDTGRKTFGKEKREEKVEQGKGAMVKR